MGSIRTRSSMDTRSRYIHMILLVFGALWVVAAYARNSGGEGDQETWCAKAVAAGESYNFSAAPCTLASPSIMNSLHWVHLTTCPLLNFAPPFDVPAHRSAATGRTLQQQPAPGVLAHKQLMPVSARDIGLFVAAAVSLFIAAGAGIVSGMGRMHSGLEFLSTQCMRCNPPMLQ